MWSAVVGIGLSVFSAVTLARANRRA
jgi:hypothetical protein